MPKPATFEAGDGVACVFFACSAFVALSKKSHKSGEDNHSRTNQVRLTPPAVEPSPSPAWARELLNQQSSMRLRKCKGVNALSFFAEIASNTAALPAIKVFLPYAEEDATELGWDRSVTSSAEEDKRTQH
jgi:hypothetical protein